MPNGRTPSPMRIKNIGTLTRYRAVGTMMPAAVRSNSVCTMNGLRSILPFVERKAARIGGRLLEIDGVPQRFSTGLPFLKKRNAA